MIVAFSTSSPMVSVALIDHNGSIIYSSQKLAPMAASGAAIELLEEGLALCGIALNSAEGFVADLGPGSFTGVKVGVTLAKTFAFAIGRKASGVASFDLIDASRVVAIPSKKGEYLVRWPGRDPERHETVPTDVHAGYGAAFDEPVYPLAERFCNLMGRLDWVEPEILLPYYVLEPSISTPKKPYAGPTS